MWALNNTGQDLGEDFEPGKPDAIPHIEEDIGLVCSILTNRGQDGKSLQDKLVREGYRMRVYVPFGTQWYPYLMRRLAERPANVAFLTGSVFKEMVGRRR